MQPNPLEIIPKNSATIPTNKGGNGNRLESRLLNTPRSKRTQNISKLYFDLFSVLSYLSELYLELSRK